jgi:hypothetical protein
MTERRFRMLVERALVATRDLDDSREVEPYYRAVLDALLAFPLLRGYAGRLFAREIAAARTFSADLIAYCMHTLRWPEIREHVVRLNIPEDSEEWRRKSHDYRDVLRAYEDDWRGRPLYTLYDGA